MNKCKILSTRKLPQAFHSALPANIELHTKEFIAIQHVDQVEVQKKIDQLTISANEPVFVFTSSHAVIHPNKISLERLTLAERRIYCLSGATQKAVEEKLEAIPVSGVADNAKGLASKIVCDGIREVIFFCGDKRRDELPDHLNGQGIKVHEVVVYNTILTPVAITEEFDAVLFFSPSGVESFFSANTLPGKATCIVIGETTATSLKEFAENEVIVCAQPSNDDMLDAIKEFTSKKKLNNDIEK